MSCYNESMKILLYTYDIVKIGGIETSFYNLAKYLMAKGHSVGVRYSKADPMRIKHYKNAGIDIKPAKSELCDVLFIGSIWQQPRLINAKLVIQQCHADWSDDFWKGAGGAMQMIKNAEKNVDVYACVSESSASFVRKVTKKPVIIMYNLAPEQKTIAKEKHKRLVLAAFTRMTKEKGLDNYIALRDRLIELGIDAEYRVYTNGEAPDGWTPYEPVPDITKELTGIDIVCSLADTESFGYTIAEANSCGVPCIIKRANSTAEFFDDDSNLIIDDVTEINAPDLNKKVKSYPLFEMSRQNIDDVLTYAQSEQSKKCIIKCMRNFKDIEASRFRHTTEIFSVSKDRAKQLLSHELNLVKEL